MFTMTPLHTDGTHGAHHWTDIPEIMRVAHQRHQRFRSIWHPWFITPAPVTTWFYVLQELGEVCDAHTRENEDHARGTVRTVDMSKELADLWLMLDMALTNAGGGCLNETVIRTVTVLEPPTIMDISVTVCKALIKGADSQTVPASHIDLYRAMTWIAQYPGFNLLEQVDATLSRWEKRAAKRKLAEAMEEAAQYGIVPGPRGGVQEV